MNFTHTCDSEHLSLKYLRCNRIDAYDNGDKVGYIKIDYTTPDLIKYPTVWHMANEQGWCFSDISIEDTYETIDLDKAKQWYKTIRQHQSIYEELTQKEDIIAHLKKLEKSKLGDRIRGKFKSQYKWFLRHPSVAFVRTTKSEHHGIMEDYSGKGYGKLLYLEAAKWVHENHLGKGIYASSLQSDSAKNIWKYFACQHLVFSYNGRSYIKWKETL